MKPHRLPPEFASLSQADVDTINRWLDELTLKDVRQKLRETFNIEMDDSKLSRYNSKRALARDLSDHTDLALDVQDILNLFNGHPVRYDAAGVELIQKRAFELLACRKTSASKLAALLRIFHYRKQCEWTERRLAQTEKRNEISERLAKIKEAEHEQRTRKIEAEEKRASERKSSEEHSESRKPNPFEGMETHEFFRTLRPRPRPRRPAVRRAKSRRNHDQEPRVEQTPDSNPDPDQELSPDQELNSTPALDSDPDSQLDHSSASNSLEHSAPNFASTIPTTSTAASKPPSRSARRAASSPAKPGAMPNVKTHILARWLSYIPLPPRQPGNEPPRHPGDQPHNPPGGQASTAPDPAWQDQCPCGNPLPCAAHADLWREVRYSKPWDTTFLLNLTIAGIPIHLPDPADLPERAHKFLTLAKSNLEKIPEYHAAHLALASNPSFPRPLSADRPTNTAARTAPGRSSADLLARPQRL